ncbi:MAG TPA: fluoride efflux transporter CrcB [Rhabdaerophilum sp.]|nr:fluoride efflux transporter CrcB [Rhabdaerophilum sp.]
MNTALLVFLGGGIGAVGRWAIGLGAMRLLGVGFPYGTLLVNLAGCFAMGALARILFQAEQGGHDLRIFLMTGVLGGFTTFSAFSLEVANLWMRQESGAALLYILLSVGGSLAGIAAGLWLGGMLAR